MNTPSSMTMDDNESPFWRRFWCVALAIVLVWVIMCQTSAIVLTRTGVFWDDVQYHNQFLLDQAALRSGSPGAIVSQYLLDDPARPPLHRIAMIPILLTGTTDYSLLTLYIFALSLGSVYLAYCLGKRVAGATAGLVLASIWALSYPYCQHTRMMLMEATCYLMLWATWLAMLRPDGHDAESRRGWVILGICIGLGALAKFTYLVIMVPMVALAWWTAWKRTPAYLYSARAMGKAVLLGALIALPRWIATTFTPIGYALFAGNFERHAQGTGLVGKLMVYLQQGPGELIGVCGGVLIVLAILAAIITYLRKAPLTGVAGFCVLLGLVGTLPLLAMSFAGHNQNLRLIAPAAVPLITAVVIVLLISCRGRWRIALYGVMLACLATQAGALLDRNVLAQGPTGLTVRPVHEVRWDELRDRCDRRSLTNPTITYLGHVANVNPPILRQAWLLSGRVIDAPQWLWNYPDGETTPDALLTNALEYDVVLVAPADCDGDRSENQHLDNIHNGALFELLSQDDRFDADAPIAVPATNGLTMHVFYRVDVPGTVE